MKKTLVSTITALAIIATQALPMTAISTPDIIADTVITTSAANYAPAKVTGVKASKSYTTITLSWTKVSKAKGYRVYIYDTATKKYKKITTISKSGTTSYKVTGLTADTAYKFKVRAYRKVSGKTYWGKSSAAVSATTKSYAPVRVTNLTAKATSQTAGALTWKKIANATGYRVYVYNTATKKYVKVSTITSNKNTYNLTGLKAGTSYKYKVRAYRKVSGKNYWGTSSAAVTLTTKQDALYAAYEAILRGDSTAQQRELIRQDLIAYVLEQEPSFILDESLYAYADANGNPTENLDKAVYWGNSGFEVGADTDLEMSYYHMNILGDVSNGLSIMSQDECVKSTKERFKEHIDSTIKCYREGLRRIESFNIVLLYTYHSSVELNTGLILPSYGATMVLGV